MGGRQAKKPRTPKRHNAGTDPRNGLKEEGGGGAKQQILLLHRGRKPRRKPYKLEEASCFFRSGSAGVFDWGSGPVNVAVSVSMRVAVGSLPLLRLRGGT